MRNRIMMDSDSGEVPPIRVPRAAAPPITPAGFVMFSPLLLPYMTPEQWCWQQWIYQQAFEKAQAVATPSIVERDLAGYWN